MIKCDRCHCTIPSGDEYVQDGIDRICMNCLDAHIFDQYDIVDLARELGMKIKEVPEEKKTDPDKPLVGQMDMFGGVVGENA